MADLNFTLAQSRLKELFDYDSSTGNLTWRVAGKHRDIGSTAGGVGTCKARAVKVDGKVYTTAHLVWVYVFGVAPRTRLVHVNGIATDDRIENLRERSGDPSDELTSDRLKELVSYNPDTGVFTRKIRTSNRINLGSTAGHIRKDGYVGIKIDGRAEKCHRLAWLYVYGCWPENEIDHINGDPSDNRIANLRDISHAHNTQNTRKPRSDNTSGFLGVHAWNGGFVASINVDKKRIKLGTFSTAEEAHAAYVEAKRRLHSTCTI